MADLSKCAGCRNDFYNDKNPLGVKKCWSLDTATIVTRYRIGTWTDPTQPGAFTKVTTHDCHQGEGYHHYKKEELPSCAVGMRS